jgi:hypothetical protein
LAASSGAAGLGDQRGDDADGRGLAGAVRTEQREEVAIGHVEVDALQRLHAVLVGLRELTEGQGLHGTRHAKGVRSVMRRPGVSKERRIPADLE